MFRASSLLVYLLFCGCSSSQHMDIAVLNYKDFGPQVIASEVIGMEWWQWQLHGGSRPKDYTIRVVVYRDLPLEEVEKIFPVVPEQEQDYRYVQYDAALHYLDEKIGGNIIGGTTARLQETRKKIIAQLGKNN